MVRQDGGMHKVIRKPSNQLALDFDVETAPVAIVMDDARPAGNTGDRHVSMPLMQIMSALQIKLPQRAEANHRLREQGHGQSGAEQERRSLLAASNDPAAIETWIAARCADESRDRAGRPNHTTRAYRREARRFLLWLQTERDASLEAARLEDCLAYKMFLSDPQPRAKWCARRGPTIGSPQWRPFEGPLGASAVRQAITILSSLYRFLQDQRYLIGNPWGGVAMPRGSAPKVDTNRHISRTLWAVVEAEGKRQSTDLRAKQTDWVVRFLQSTGLRLAEICSAQCGDLAAVTTDATECGEANGMVVDGTVSTMQSTVCADVDKLGSVSWVINVLGKGMKLRCVPVPESLVQELGVMLMANGVSPDPRSHSDRPLVVSMHASSRPGVHGPLTPQGLYRQVKRHFLRIACRLRAEGQERDARVLESASTHWLRHTCGSHSVACGVPIDVVQQNMGHASLATTTKYVRSDLDRRIAEQARLWNRQKV